MTRSSGTPELGGATRTHRVALQHALTARLMGAPFLPRASRGAATEAPIVEGKPAPPAAAPAAGAGSLDELRQRHAATCPHCTASRTHTNIVFGEGDPNARLMFIGEAPGEEEDRTGRPFVGRAGQKLDEMIRAMGMCREDVYIANVLKTRPPNNATPTPEEAAACGPFLIEQIALVAPEVIVTLGNPATHFLLDTTDGITRLRGTWQDFRGVPVMPTFHPAYILRNYTDDTRRKVWSDLKKVMDRLGVDPRGRPS